MKGRGLRRLACPTSRPRSSHQSTPAAAPDDLPAPAERKRLREAAGLSQDQVSNALNVRRETVTGWEAGRTEPRPPKRAAYARLLDGLTARFPAPGPPRYLLHDC